MEETSTQTSLAMHPEITSGPRTKFDSAVDAFISYMRNLSHFWFTHIILILILIGYTLSGAYLFHYLEVDYHDVITKQAFNIRNKIMNELWNKSQNINASKAEWILAFKTKMSGYQDQLCDENIWMDELINYTSWSFVRAVFYCGTVFTATGYGNIVPRTLTGQIMTVIYAVIGIPYTLTVLLDIGSLLTNGLRRTYMEMYKCYIFGCCCWKGSSLYNVKFVMNDTRSLQLAMASTSTYSRRSEEPKNKLFRATGLKKSDFVIPVWVGFVLILFYAFLGAWLFIQYESWAYSEALYFIIASLTTIGFGDFVPKHVPYTLEFFYIIIGLSLVSLFFNLVVERISKALRKARRKIKRRFTQKVTSYRSSISESIGLDPDDLISEDKGNGKINHRSVITVQLLDSKKSMKQYGSSPQIKTTPVVLVRISDSNLLKYVQFDKIEKPLAVKLQEAFISDKNFLKYLKEKMELKKNNLHK